MMKKYFSGLLTGLLVGLLLATTTFAFAANPIKLVVNGKQIQTDVPPQVIGGRTMVPARFLAEALGAKVEWDATDSAVVVTGGVQTDATPTDLPAVQESPAQSTVPVEHNERPNPGPEWIARMDLLTKYSVASSIGEKITIKKDSKFFTVPSVGFPPFKDGDYTLSTDPLFRIKVLDSELFFSISDLQALGFVP